MFSWKKKTETKQKQRTIREPRDGDTEGGGRGVEDGGGGTKFSCVYDQAENRIKYLSAQDRYTLDENALLIKPQPVYARSSPLTGLSI